MGIVNRLRISIFVLWIGSISPIAQRVLAADNSARFIVSYNSPSQIDRNLLQSHGHQIVGDMGDAGLMVVKSSVQ